MNSPVRNGGKTITICLRFVWLLLLSACLTPVDFPVEHAGGSMVISGQISNIKDQNYIQVGRTADTERLPYPLSGAAITVFDDGGGSYAFTEDTLRPGIYLPADNFLSEYGRTYHIQVSANGKTYESAPEKMPEPTGQVNTTYDFENKEYTDLEGLLTRQYFINLYAAAELTPSAQTSYLKWGIEEAYLLSPTDFPDPFGSVPRPCYIVQNADPQRIVLFNSDDNHATSFQNLLIGSRIIDWSFLERHYFTTYQSSLTKEAYAYWRKVNTLSTQVGSIFDTPPAKLIGNIRNTANATENVYGYFQAVSQSYTRFFLLPVHLPFAPTNTTCTFDNRNDSQYPSRCLDCLTVRNSSYNRPEWF